MLIENRRQVKKMNQNRPVITLGTRNISDDTLPYIIAEIGLNHENDMDKAKLMIKQAAEGGADAVKFQTYKNKTLATSEYIAKMYEGANFQYELDENEFNEPEYRELAKYSKEHDVTFCSTPFNKEAVEFLYDLMPFYKIASADITNLPFIKQIVKKGKPIILSTGASTIGEIDDAVKVIAGEGNQKLVLCHCVLNYPNSYENANLNMIKHLRKVYPQYLTGYSDHTSADKSMNVLTTAWLYGASVLEKHFTFDKTRKGFDHEHAMDINDLKVLVGNLKLIQKISGKEFKEPLETEKTARSFARRSLVSTSKIPAGTIITEKLLIAKRPGTGISPKYLDMILGKKVKRAINEDQTITWDDFF